MKVIPHSMPCLEEGEIKEVIKVLKSKQIAQGKKVEEFEEKLAKYIGVKYAAALNSGTSALFLSLIALGVKKGDEVIIPTYTCSALLNSILYVGAKPVICDINEKDFNISFDEIKKKINKKTKVIIVPHMFGNPADIEEILKLGVSVIEDCAQAIGAEYKNIKVGNFGKLSIFSFYATKVMTTGEGGAVVSNNERLIKIVKDLREYDKKYSYKLRFNFKMTDIQAAIGIVQLGKLEEFIRKRREIAQKYLVNLKNKKVILPVEEKLKKNIYYRFIVRTDKLEDKIRKFRKKGIISERPIFIPLHRYLKIKGFPVAEKIFKTAVSIPIYPGLNKKNIDFIINSFKIIFR